VGEYFFKDELCRYIIVVAVCNFVSKTVVFVYKVMYVKGSQERNYYHLTHT